MASSLTPLADALQQLLAVMPEIPEVETLPLAMANGRILAEEVVADIDVPPQDNSAMDGYAIRAADLSAVPCQLRLVQRIAAGATGQPLAPGEAARIFTGAPMPPGADAVVMQENCSAEGDAITVQQTVGAGENLRRRGNDVGAGTVLFASGRRLRPQDLGVMASVGREQVSVRRRLRVALMATGDELVQPGGVLAPGQIFNANAAALTALLQALGAEVLDLGIVEDSLSATRAALERAVAAADCVISSGGVSVGEEDHVKAAVEAEGSLDLWKLAIKPGKPFASGTVQGRRFFGLPGNPVSAFVTFVLVVRPCLLAMLGCRELKPEQFPLPSGFARSESGERQEYLRCRIESDAAGTPRLCPLQNQSSGVGSSLSAAQGLAIIPPHTTVTAGQALQFIPFSELLY